jgi:hypothetical protein
MRLVLGTHYRKFTIAASMPLIGLAAYVLWIADDWLQIGYLFDKCVVSLCELSSGFDDG